MTGEKLLTSRQIVDALSVMERTIGTQDQCIKTLSKMVAEQTKQTSKLIERVDVLENKPKKAVTGYPL
jgi:uncharacterized coiled-coil protein SlyX